jgi:hypothetical protein
VCALVAPAVFPDPIHPLVLVIVGFDVYTGQALKLPWCCCFRIRLVLQLVFVMCKE